MRAGTGQDFARTCQCPPLLVIADCSAKRVAFAAAKKTRKMFFRCVFPNSLLAPAGASRRGRRIASLKIR